MLLHDSITFEQSLTESIKELPGGRLRASGKFQHCGIANRNKRIYPIRVWERHCREDSDFMKAIKRRKVFGHLEHPKDGKPDLKEAAIVITHLYLKENGEVHGTMETLSTDAGKTASALLRDGLTIGVSSRAHGSVVRNAEGLDEVQDDFYPETFDLVSEESTPGAELHESLQRTLEQKGPEAIRRDETTAKFQVQLEALSEECYKQDWSSSWQGRLNDLKYMIAKIDESPYKTEIERLNEFIRMKKELQSKPPGVFSKISERNYRLSLLIEQAEVAAKEASDAADKAEMAAEKASKEAEATGTPANSDIEVAAVEAKVAAKEAEAAAEIAKSTSSPEVAAAAAEKAKEAADKARAAADMSGQTSESEEMEMEPEMEMSAGENTVVTQKVECSIPFDSMSDGIRKEINVLRPGEDLSQLLSIVNGKLEAAGVSAKNVFASWSSESEISVSAEVADSSKVDQAKTVILNCLSSETVPEEATEVEMPESVGKNQYIRHLKESNDALLRENTRLKTDLENMKHFNSEMARLFEKEVIKYECGFLLQRTPELREFKEILYKSPSIKRLHETAQAFLRAMKSKKKILESSSRKGSLPKKQISTVEVGSKEVFLPSLTESVVETVPVADETELATRNDNMFSRLRRHRESRNL